VVAALEAAGAVLAGKTNMDQFATGLVGTRSPYGIPESVLAPGVIAGGSSSGSAVAVAAGLVDIALGTDTAGSGRVPAAMNGIVGFKPTRSMVSTDGVVPACRSLDCVSVFARTCELAWRTLGVLAADAAPARRDAAADARAQASPRVGVPRDQDLEWFGDDEAPALFAQALERLRSMGATIVPVDFAPFAETAGLLYGGPWVAERLAAVGGFVAANPDAVHPVVREVILAAADRTAVDAYNGWYRLEQLLAQTAPTWEAVDVLAMPTASIAPTVEETLADPHGVQTRLGRYTNFVNLMNLCAVSLPAGRRSGGAPFGLQLVAPPFADGLLAALGTRFESTAPEATVRLAVVGAHLAGQPLNHQLTRRGARLLTRTRTAPAYRLHALAGTVPPKPGLARSTDGDGAAIEVEVWELDTAAFGAFTAEVPPPLGIGTVELEDGTSVKGFICEPAGLAGATDITRFGGWRAYLAAGPA
jgi:allophanate hydrolase